MYKNLIITIFKCVSLGIGIGVTCLCLLEAIELNKAITLLGAATISLSFAIFIEGNNK